MRAWGRIKKGEYILSEATVSLDIKKRAEMPMDMDYISAFIGELAHELDIERPVIVKKHVSELKNFGHVIFKKTDFIDAIDFDRFIVEIIA